MGVRTRTSRAGSLDADDRPGWSSTSAVHATGSRSFTRTQRKVAARDSRQIQSLFTYVNSFMDADRNGLYVLIADEGHRLRETSANRWTKAALRSGKAQVDELIGAARVPVFLLDQNQVVRPGEMGTAQDIEKSARERGLDVHHVDLSTQYRCGRSEAYIDWVERLLGLKDGGPTPWAGDPTFEVRVAHSPSAMEAALQQHLEANYGARMAAGYCWPWSDPRKDGTLVEDVRIGDWARPWNLPGRAVRRRCAAVRTANRDPGCRNPTKASDHEFDALVRNVYKVLLSRGMRGTLLYSTDRETHAFLERMVAGGPAPRTD